MFHNAGHTIGYKDVMKVDNSLAEYALRTLDKETGAVVPENLVQDRFVLFSTDNLDILDSSLDGKNTFHATQFTAWQRGPPAQKNIFQNLKQSKNNLDVPDVLLNTIPPDNFVHSPSPKFDSNVNINWFTES